MIGLGEAISAVGLGVQLWGKFKGGQQWEESEKLVNLKWAKVAQEKGLLDPSKRYVWRRAADVETTLLEGKFDLVYALDKERKIKYRLTTGGTRGLVLMGLKKIDQ